MIQSAVLLAAGRGKRQRPFTDVIPKPLLPVQGRVTLDYVLTAVRAAGVDRVCMVTHHLEDKLFGYVGDGARWNLSVTFAHQPELRGSADALTSVPRAWIRKESFMVAATDYILREDSLRELVEAHTVRNADISMSLKECMMEEIAKRSNVDVASDWHVKQIIEKPNPDQIVSPYAASMIFIFPSDIWKYLLQIQTSPRGEKELQSAVQMMIEDGYKAYGLLQPTPLEWSPKLASMAD